MSETNYRRRLPHIRADGAIYFTTWRLRPGLSNDERDEIAAAIRHFDGTRYRLHAYVVMNDHVHVVVEPSRDVPLATIVHSWKSFTANRLQRTHGRSGAVWQEEYFDRVIRDDGEYEQKCDYVLHNAFKRWPEIDGYRWCWVIGSDET